MTAKDLLIHYYKEERKKGVMKQVAFLIAKDKVTKEYNQKIEFYKQAKKDNLVLAFLHDLHYNVNLSGISLTQECEFQFQAEKQGLTVSMNSL